MLSADEDTLAVLWMHLRSDVGKDLSYEGLTVFRDGKVRWQHVRRIHSLESGMANYTFGGPPPGFCSGELFGDEPLSSAIQPAPV